MAKDKKTKKTVKPASKTAKKPVKKAVKKPASKKTVKKASKPPVKKNVKTAKPVKKSQAKPVKKTIIKAEKPKLENTPVNKESMPETLHIPELQLEIPGKSEPENAQEQDLSLPEGDEYQQAGQRRPLIVFPK